MNQTLNLEANNFSLELNSLTSTTFKQVPLCLVFVRKMRGMGMFHKM